MPVGDGFHGLTTGCGRGFHAGPATAIMTRVASGIRLDGYRCEGCHHIMRADEATEFHWRKGTILRLMSVAAARCAPLTANPWDVRRAVR